MKLIDLSHALESQKGDAGLESPFMPTPRTTISADGYNSTMIRLSTHYGTHLDAPFHFFEDGKTIDRMRLEQFYGPATLIDFGNLEPKTPLTLAMFAKHESVFKSGAKVIYRTGWHRMFGSEAFVTEFPTLTLEAARWIASKRIGLLGMDTPTPSTEWLECHHALLEEGVEIVIVEGLNNLDQLPERFTYIGFPLNIKGRDGSPIRAVAIVD